MMENKTRRLVAVTRYIKDIDKEDESTNYDTLAEIRELFGKLNDCDMIVTKIKNKNVVIVFHKNTILVYKYKMI